jgi:HlyD family secretion protein
MKTIYSRTRHFIKTNKWWTALIIIIVIIFVWVFFGQSKSAAIETVTAQKETLVEEVSATGNVKPLSDIDLAFEIGGRVSDIAVSVGEKVSVGQYLASISNGDLSAAVEQAQAALQATQANLATLKNGSTPQSIAVTQSQVSQAKNNLVQAEDSLDNAIQDAYTKSDDAIRNNADLLFNTPQTQNVTLKFQADSQITNNLDNMRPTIETILNSWNASTTDFSNATEVDQTINTISDNLNTIKSFLDNVALAINSIAPDSSSVNVTTLNEWKANVSLARTEVANAITSFSEATTAYTSAESAVNVAENQLILAQTPATTDQIAAEQAAVDGAQASVDEAQAQLAKSIIRSPIDGVVTNVVPDVGETVQSGAIAISVISYGDYEVESYVPEADIAKVQIGDIATTTLDAYGSDTFFQTQVIKIDPAETVIEGVSTYKVTLKFIANDARIKSGMTANLDILTNTKQNVIAVPARSVYTSNDQRFVQFVDPKNPNKPIERQVTTGIRGIDGSIEVISGLNVGDTIVSSPNI